MNLAIADGREFAERTDAIAKATPDWVRVCRAKNHNVMLMSADKQADGSYRCEWQCTCCGKDRR